MATLDDVFKNAVTWVNSGPYTWGGVARNGNDCSGFIYGVLKEVGAPLPYRMTAEGIRQFCTPISSEEAKPGDLVFIENTDPDIWNRERPGPDGKIASHIGFVDVDWPTWILDSHERNATSGVNYTNVTTPYWAPKIIEVRRLPMLEAGSVPEGNSNDLEAWYRGYLANLIGPEGELQKAVQDILSAKNLPQSKVKTLALKNRLDTLWREYNG